MKLTRLFYLLVLWCSTITITAAQSQNWNIIGDPKITFSGSGADGHLSGLKGTIVFDEEHLEDARFDVTLDIGTISTGNKTKDKHARGSSWFDVDAFPKARFISTEVYSSPKGYIAKGMLTLHGIEKVLTIPFTFTQKDNTGEFKGNFAINRQDYGIEGPFIGFMVGDDFEVELQVPVQH